MFSRSFVMSVDLSLRSTNEGFIKVKPRPKTSVISVPFDYNPSDDGTDENLLILLHGLGNLQPLLINVYVNTYA